MTDLSMTYTYANNNQVYKGDIGRSWSDALPQNDDAKTISRLPGCARR